MLHHQFWVTKKTVQRKLGSKEDEHVISSDADLDAKIEVFKSIADTSFELGKIIDQLQERLCILSQEECVLGRFLKEVGKRSKTTGQSITNTGKAVSYSGQQRMCVRVPLLRLQHEVEVFRSRAVRDTECTLQNMEKERTEYRAALSWMKSASSELDPDTGRGLDKFRIAQSHVRVAKQNFDSLSMDSIQKIDLLAAARCNMYSHALISYMTELKQFSEKTASTFETISMSLVQKPRYDFCVLKDLTQEEESINQQGKDIGAVDKDHLLFFSSEYVDDYDKEPSNPNNSQLKPNNDSEKILIELTKGDQEENNGDDIDLNQASFDWSNLWYSKPTIENTAPCINNKPTSTATLRNSLAADKTHKLKTPDELQTPKKAKSNNPWMDLFAELDPLGNPDAFDFKLNEGRTNFQQI